MRRRDFLGLVSGAVVACAQRAERLRQAVATFAIGASFIPALFACSAMAQSETNILTCVLEHEGSEFRGIREVPCSVNALAIDIDGPNPTKACASPPRRVQATLREIGANWLGTMQGKFHSHAYGEALAAELVNDDSYPERPAIGSAFSAAGGQSSMTGDLSSSTAHDRAAETHRR